MAGLRRHREVTSHPAQDRFPSGCPTDSPRSDLRGYGGLHLRLWVNQRDAIETALYRPHGLDEDGYAVLLTRMYEVLLRYRGLPERVHPDGRQPVNTDRFRLLDIGVDATGTWGPGLAFPPGPLATLEELTEAAVYDLRDRMPD